MSDVQITAFSIAHPENYTAAGHRRAANFDVYMRGIKLNGCAILERDGELVAVLPEARRARDGSKPITIGDRKLAEEFQSAAIRQYRLFTADAGHAVEDGD